MLLYHFILNLHYLAQKRQRISQTRTFARFCGVGKNQWRVTAYETTREKDKTFGDVLFADKRPLSNLDKSNPTTKKQTNRPKMMINFD